MKVGDLIRYDITVRCTSATYVARVKKFNFTASCTMGEEQAARTVAKKFCATIGVKMVCLERVGQVGASAWVLRAKS